MEREILNQIKLDIEDTKEILETNFEEMTELEKDEKVQRYIRLSKLKQEVNNGLKLKTNDDIAKHEFWKYTNGMINETNDIWFLLGVYDSKSYYESFKEELPNNKVLVYINIENSKMYEAVSLDKQEEFELRHIVIESTKQYDWNMYYKIKDEFFLNCINTDQNTAKKIILKKY